jgi:hypothetical protein
MAATFEEIKRQRAESEVAGDRSLRRRLGLNDSGRKPGAQGPLSPAAREAYEKALARRTHQTDSQRTANAHGMGRSGGSVSPADNSAYERAKEAQERLVNGGPAAVNARKPIATHTGDPGYKALARLSNQKPRVPSRATFKAKQNAKLSTLAQAQKMYLHAKILHNQARAQDNLRSPNRVATMGRLPASELHHPQIAHNTSRTAGNAFALTSRGVKRFTTANALAALGATNTRGRGAFNMTNRGDLAQLLVPGGGANNNAALIAELIIGSIGEAIVLRPGLFSSGAFSGLGGGAGIGGGGPGAADYGPDAGNYASAFDSGCVYLPNGDNGQNDPNGSPGGVLLSTNSDPYGNGDGGANGGPDGSAGASPDGDPSQQIGLSGAPDGNGTDGNGIASPDGDANQQTGLTDAPNGNRNQQTGLTDAPNGDGGTEVSPTVYDGGTTPVDAVPQVGRYLNVINLSASPATVFVQYHSQDQNGNWNWFPAAPDMSQDAISFDVNPGQAVELYDGDWHVYADKARVWAASTDGAHQWNRFQDTDLLLVSETDDQGQPCYYSPDIQTLSFGLK